MESVGDDDEIVSVPLEEFFPKPGHCKYILDDGPWITAAPKWCNKKAEKGSIYCPYHRARCYQKK